MNAFFPSAANRLRSVLASPGMSTLPLLLVALGMFSVSACGSTDAGMSIPPPGLASRSSDAEYKVVLDTSGLSELSSGELDGRRMKAIDAIIARVPSALRSQARMFFADREKSGGFAGSSDIEIARHLSVLSSIHAVEDARKVDGQRDRIESLLAREKASVRITVALVPSLEPPTARATVVRLPNVGWRARVLLRESDATASDYSAALSAVRASFKSHPESPKEERRFQVFGGRAPSAYTPSKVSTQMFDALRAAKPSFVEGLGYVKSVPAAVSVIP